MDNLSSEGYKAATQYVVDTYEEANREANDKPTDEVLDRDIEITTTEFPDPSFAFGADHDRIKEQVQNVE